jgi:ankyrin repeat protein
MKINIDERDENGMTPLLTACDEFHIEIIKMLILAGADVNVADWKGHTALMGMCHSHSWSISNERKKVFFEIIKMLVEAGANIFDKADMKGLTAINYATDEVVDYFKSVGTRYYKK